MIDYTIVIPSKGRPKIAAKAMRLLPDANVYVDEREISDYKPYIPTEKLVPHAPTNNLAEVRNLMIRDFSESVLIQSDDDLKVVRVIGDGTSKLIKKPDVIIDVIENMIEIAEDLDIGLFGWNRCSNPMQYFHGDPLALTSPIAGTFGVRGPARYRKLDSTVYPRADFDWVMYAILKDRITLVDRRFYFDHGPVFSGKGGTVDVIKANQFQRATEILIKRWGRYIKADSYSNVAGNMGKSSTRTRSVQNKNGMSIKVRRKNQITFG